MRPGIIVDVTAADRGRLEAIVADRNSLRSTSGVPRSTGDGRRAPDGGDHATHRQEQDRLLALAGAFADKGGDGLLRDTTRPSRITPFGPEVGERTVALTLAEPPHWTGTRRDQGGRASASLTCSVWRSHGLQLLRTVERGRLGEPCARQPALS